MLNHFEYLGVNFKPVEESKKLELIKELEEITGVLPDDYKEFLMHYGSNVRFNDFVNFGGIEPSPWADEDGFDDIEYFYGLSDVDNGYILFETIETYANDFEMKLIPIGASSGGNQICMALTERGNGTIWFWDHESDPVFDGDKIISGFTFVANNFTDFVIKIDTDL